MSFDLALVDGDIKIQTDGSVKTYTDTPKLRQDIIKIILTSLSSNKFYPWYGCDLADSFIGRNVPDSVLFAELETSISDSLTKLTQLQKAQSSNQEVSLAELISKVLGVSASRDAADPRQVNIFVSILTKRLTKVEEVFTIIS